MEKFAITGIVIAALLPLAACLDGGGGSGSIDQGSGDQDSVDSGSGDQDSGDKPVVQPETPQPEPGSKPKPEPVTIRSLTGMAPPAETVADQMARDEGIADNADHLSLTTIHGNTDHPSLPTFAEAVTSCEDASCKVSNPDVLGGGTMEFTTPYDLHFFGDDADPGDSATGDAIGTKNGITLVNSSYVDTGNNPHESVTFGAWMTHGAFGLLTLDIEEEGVSISSRYAMAGGKLTGTAPSGSATWRGLMVGTPATGSRRGELLTGDATLSYDFRSLDATFDNIKNIDRLAAHTTETVSFNDIAVDGQGTFEAGQTGNRIQGGFYGPGHAEAAGIFEQSNIVGAFGAKRQ